jgi:ADP-ribosylglycohydrolase
MDQQAYLEKVYSGLIGKSIGVRLGAPVEPTIWTYDRIRKTYGDIRGYVKDYRNFAADDDINGPLFFIRALHDFPAPVTACKIGRTWLNYTREGIGFYWWGGYGRSTEHTAYLNLKAGMEAPLSGSLEVNGAAVAEQIGGQIFIDSWGWVIPGDYRKAAEYAGMAASVGHDRNGIYGGRFIAACVSLAFIENDIAAIINSALEVIPRESEYCRVVHAVREFHAAHPENWRDARDFLESDFGYDKYPGVCHIIPNAGVCALALYYGAGDYARTIEIATMCGWDTDCNAGNVGAILGVMVGMEGIPDHYIRPLNDFHAASSIAGALNIIDLPTAARELAMLGLREQQRSLSEQHQADTVPEHWHPGTFSDDIALDLTLPKSTGGLRTSSPYLAPIGAGEDFGERGKTIVLLDRLQRGDTARIFYKPYYTRADFDDERYSPTFTPQVYPGQQLTITGTIERMSGQRIALAPYVRDSRTGTVTEGAYTFPAPGTPFSLTWKLPEVDFAIDEAGLLATNFDAEKFLGRLAVETFTIAGKRQFVVQFRDEHHEFKGLSRCSAAGGAWELEDEGLRVITNDNFQLFSGPYYTTDSTVSCELMPEYGSSHLVAFRCRGAESGYYFGLHGNNTAALIKKDHELTILAEVPFIWQKGSRYQLEISVSGNSISGRINGNELVCYTDEKPLPYGMAGAAKLGAGRTLFFSLAAAEE